jgi:hypothetical protein
MGADLLRRLTSFAATNFKPPAKLAIGAAHFALASSISRRALPFGRMGHPARFVLAKVIPVTTLNYRRRA